MQIPEGVFNVIITENKADKLFCCFVKTIYNYMKALQTHDDCEAQKLYQKILCMLPLYLLNISDTPENNQIINRLRAKAEKICECDC